MTVLLAALGFLSFCSVAFALLAFVDSDPLAFLDDRDRRHLVAVAQAHEQPLALFAAELDEILSLPETEPWKRWLG